MAAVVGGPNGTRNAPSLLMAAEHAELFWDGREHLLASQAIRPLLNAHEHGLTQAHLLQLLRQSKRYVALFRGAFPLSTQPISLANVGMALACFEQGLNAEAHAAIASRLAESAEERGPAVVRGEALFRGRAGCSTCHLFAGDQAALTDGKFHRRGIHPPKVSTLAILSGDATRGLTAAEREAYVASSADQAALGRYLVTGLAADIGKFRTPSLWSVDDTPPYMHDGSVETLEDAIAIEAYYGKEEGSMPIILSAGERADLASFLRSLSLKTVSGAGP